MSRNLTSSRLKEATLERLVDVMENGEIVSVFNKETGELEHARETPSASLMNAAINFLKEFPPYEELPEPSDLEGQLKGYTQVMPVR